MKFVGVWESALKEDVNVFEHVKNWPGQSERDTHFFVYKNATAPPPSPTTSTPGGTSTSTNADTTEQPGEVECLIAPKKVFIPGMNMHKALMEEAIRKRKEKEAKDAEDGMSGTSAQTPASPANAPPSSPSTQVLFSAQVV